MTTLFQISNVMPWLSNYALDEKRKLYDRGVLMRPNFQWRDGGDVYEIESDMGNVSITTVDDIIESCIEFDPNFLENFNNFFNKDSNMTKSTNLVSLSIIHPSLYLYEADVTNGILYSTWISSPNPIVITGQNGEFILTCDPSMAMWNGKRKHRIAIPELWKMLEGKMAAVETPVTKKDDTVGDWVIMVNYDGGRVTEEAEVINYESVPETAVVDRCETLANANAEDFPQLSVMYFPKDAAKILTVKRKLNWA